LLFFTQKHRAARLVRRGARPEPIARGGMPPGHSEKRFLQYQIRAIRRFQRLRTPGSREEAQRLALEWIGRFADSARRRWLIRTGSGAEDALHGRLSSIGTWKP
jgi:hypothetical protein